MKKLEKMMLEGIRDNDLKKVAWALNLGLDINTLLDGFTPLHLAVIWNRIEIAKLLIDSGADVMAKEDRYGRTPLHEAVYWRNIELAKLLIASGADVNAKTNYGFTPLHRAYSQKMKALLREHGAIE